MKYILLPICIIISIVLTGVSCKKTVDKDPMPPATQTGENTMGCYVNGKPWLPNTEPFGSIPGLKPTEASFWNTQDQLIFIFYRHKSPDKQSLNIYIKDFKGKGVYNMNSTSKVIGIPGSYGELNNYFYFSDNNENEKFTTNENNTGTINITYFNSDNRIISGVFHFKAQNINGNLDSVIVKDGRFDLLMNN